MTIHMLLLYELAVVDDHPHVVAAAATVAIAVPEAVAVIVARLVEARISVVVLLSCYCCCCCALLYLALLSLCFAKTAPRGPKMTQERAKMTQGIQSKNIEN